MPRPSNRRRGATSPLEQPQIKRRRISLASAASIIQDWLHDHPNHQDEYEFSVDVEEVPAEAPIANNPSKKRGQYTCYYDPTYLGELAARGSFPRSSPAGLKEDDRILCSQLVSPAPISPEERLFLGEMPEKCDRLRGLSSFRVFFDLFGPASLSAVQEAIHPDVVAECYGFRWTKAAPFYGPPPQPHHTYGFRPSVFTETQKRKLHMKPFHKSYYAATSDLWFPFLTRFVKCGTAARDIAERAVTHAMTVALRGIVDLYQRANRASDVHRRALGFSIFSDDRNAVISVHYPEIDAQGNVSYYRDVIVLLEFQKNLDIWACGQLASKICQQFAPILFEQLTSVIDQLPDPGEVEEDEGGDGTVSDSDEETYDGADD